MGIRLALCLRSSEASLGFRAGSRSFSEPKYSIERSPLRHRY
jgi:hypothetical protein